MRTQEVKTIAVAFCLVTSALLVHASAQVPFEQAVADLKSPDADTRFRAVELLKDAAYPEGAVPLAGAINDQDPDIQMQAMAGELNIFLADKVPARRRVGLVVERRSKGSAEAAFAAGRSAVGARAVPAAVPAALRGAMRSASPRVALEALYTFGTLAPEVAAADRPELLRSSAADMAAMLALPAPATRIAALHVAGRLYAKRPGDGPVEQMVGDAAIAALNDRNTDVKGAAMQALGAMKYGRAVQGLTDLFAYYKRGSLAEQALDALAQIGSPASVPVFTSQLAAAPALRRFAVEGIARAGDRSKAHDVDDAAAGASTDAVNMAALFAAAELANAPLEQIVEGLARPGLHDQALGYLVELAPGRVRQLTQGARDPDPRIRAEIADVLGLSGDPAAIPVVAAMAGDSDPQTARAAARAAVRLGPAR